MKTYADLLELARTNGTLIEPKENSPPVRPLEADDDPYRLARVNLESYRSRTQGVLKYWRDEWWTWKPSRGCYREVPLGELKARVTQSIKEEFDRLNVIAQEDATSDPPNVTKVTRQLVGNVMGALEAMCCISSSVEPMTWLDDPDGTTRPRNCVALQNGILDLDLLLAGVDDPSECMQPHNPEWFSTVCLPYDFDPDATWPRWNSFLEKSLDMDPERYKILQEWAGYLLLPDTGEQKFMILEGEGNNGKSVYLAGLTAMLGQQNCSHIPLEIFGDRFSKSQTLGKLVNISADAAELDKVAEGFLKSFTSGDVMFFDRKGISGINTTPTARLMVSVNNRPRFSDRSSGVWRRMLLVPFDVEIQKHERIRNMDKPWWWRNQGELPGMLNWALIGLKRLRDQQGFTESALVQDAIEDYRNESNPARAFLSENIEANSGGRIQTQILYKFYVDWCADHGNRPLNERSFGREVTRLFKFSKKKRGRSGSGRFSFYEGIRFSADEIGGKKTYDADLF